MSENVDKRTATQKIDDLEKVCSILFQSYNQVGANMEQLLKLKPEVDIIKEALQLLNKKTEAIILSAKEETGITPTSVSNLVTQRNVEELKRQVEAYVANGHLVPAETVSDDSYLVAAEYDKDNNVVNPRVQFRLDTQEKLTVDTFKGKKVGDTVSLGENKFSAQVLEIYTIVPPKAPDPTPTTDAATNQAEAAQSTTETSSAQEPQQATAAQLDVLPEEAPVDFGLTIHGQPETQAS